MIRTAKNYGCLIFDNGHLFDVEGDQTDNGEVFKDYEAFKSGKGICYVSEYGLEDIQEQLTDLQDLYENQEPSGGEGFFEMTDEEYRLERERIILSIAETRQTIIDQVREAFGEDYLLNDAQVEYFAEDVFGLADWAYISTYLAESFDMDDYIAYDDQGLFTDFQHEAIDNGMTPHEYLNKKDE